MMMNMYNILYYTGVFCMLLYLLQIYIITCWNIDFPMFWNIGPYIGSAFFSLLLLFIWYHIILVSKLKMNFVIKTILMICIFVLPFILVLPVISIYNLILLFYCNNPPFIDDINSVFIENKELEDNYEFVYKKELDTIYHENSNADCIAKNLPGFAIGKVNEKCWRAIYIKILNNFTIKDLHVKCPNLYKLLNKSYISNAFLSILDAHVDIPKHFGYFKGYYRYHLGYIIPEHNGVRPFIVCGNQKYEWEEGKGVLFDDIYNHYVRNDTPYRRVVLYLDIVRPELRNMITDSMIWLLSKNIILQKLDKSQHKQRSLK